MSAPTIIEGDDWGLPGWVASSSNSGDYGNSSYNTSIANIKVSWKDIEPTEGQYNWSVIESALSSGPIFLRIFASDVIHCPTWLATKYPALAYNRFRWPNAPYYDVYTQTWSDGDFYEIWDANFEGEFEELLTSFRSNIGADPNLRIFYFPHGWRWNEWTVKWIPEMVTDGVDPDDYVAWFKRTVDDYVYAVEGSAAKLVYTGGGNEEWIEGGNSDWDTAINSGDGGNALAKYVVSVGAGARIGAPEWLDRNLVNCPDYGVAPTQIAGVWYQHVDDTHSLLSGATKIWAAENESFASGADDYWHIKAATLKTLQLQNNWVFLGQKAVDVAPTLQAYAFLSFGKTVSTSGDAWVALRSAKDVAAGDEIWYRNWERWLFQREISPGGLTIAAAQHVSPLSQIGTTYEARSTDHSGGSDYIYFDVDSRFIDYSENQLIGSIQLKITYLDNNAGSWWVEYDSLDGGPYTRTDAVVNQNDNTWKTATFAIPAANAAFMGRQLGGMDFRIYNGGTYDLTVSFVRVVKLALPVECVVDVGETGDYSSLSAAENDLFGATGANLVDNDECILCRCIATNGQPDAVACAINCFTTTDEGHNLTIMAGDGYRHRGVWPGSGNVYRLDVAGTHSLLIQCNNVVIKDLAIRNQGTTDYDYVVASSGVSDVAVMGCVICRATGTSTSDPYGIFFINTDGTNYCRNNIVFDITTSHATKGWGIRVDDTGTGSFYIENNTVIDCSNGIANLTATTTQLSNNAVYNSADCYYGTWGGGSNNAWSQGADPRTSGVDLSIASPQDIFRNYVGNDFHVKDFSSLLFNAGADLSTSFVVDIDGATRSQWDIGADEIGAQGDATVSLPSALGATLELCDGGASISPTQGSGTISRYVEADGAATVSLPTVLGIIIGEGPPPARECWGNPTVQLPTGAGVALAKRLPTGTGMVAAPTGSSSVGRIVYCNGGSVIQALAGNGAAVRGALAVASAIVRECNASGPALRSGLSSGIATISPLTSVGSCRYPAASAMGLLSTVRRFVRMGTTRGGQHNASLYVQAVGDSYAEIIFPSVVGRVDIWCRSGVILKRKAEICRQYDAEITITHAQFYTIDCETAAISYKNATPGVAATLQLVGWY